MKSIDFVNRIARKAQKMNHHPDIDIRFNKVTLTLTTHDEGGSTEKDFSLAQQCEEVFFKHFAPRLTRTRSKTTSVNVGWRNASFRGYAAYMRCRNLSRASTN